MRWVRLAAMAVGAGLVTASAVPTGVAATSISVPAGFRASRIELSGPAQPLNVARDRATLVATVKDWSGKVRSNVQVTFSVLSGPDKGYSEKQTTDTSGTARTKNGVADQKQPGIDAVQASYNDGLEIHKSQRVFVVWLSGPPARSVTSDAQITVSPTCFQPASAAQTTSDRFASLKPIAIAGSAPSTTETGAINVVGQEFDPFSKVLITFDAGPGGRPQNFQAQTDGFGAFSTTITVTEPAEGTHLIRADDFRQREADTTYTVPCFMPSLALDPAIGPPGFVTTAVGTGFPPNSTIVLLNWMQPDIASPPAAVVLRTLPDGSFQYPVLILYHDIIGPRTLQAIVANPNGANAGAAIEADAPFLVTPGRSQPPDFVLRR